MLTVVPAIGVAIQPAVDIIPPGTTLNVLAGTYEEQVVITIDKELTLTGATIGGGGTSTAAKAATCTATTVLDASGGSIGIDVTSSNVTITDLCVKGAGNFQHLH